MILAQNTFNSIHGSVEGQRFIRKSEITSM